MLTAKPQSTNPNRTNRARTAARAALLLLLGAALAVASVVLPGLGLGPGLGLSLAPPPPPAVQAHAISSVSSVSITSTPAADGIYRTGEAITVRVTFPNCVTNVSQTTAALTITLDSGNVSAPLTNRASFTPSNVLNYSYTVVAANFDNDGIVIPTNAVVGTYNVRSGAGCGSGGHSSGHTYTLPNTYTTAQSGHRVNPTTDYDTDNDGLIEVRTLQQLNAIRYDANGNGDPDSSTNDTNYRNAFPNGNITTTPYMGCRSQGCRGYELANDLDFDTNRDGTVNSSDTNTYTDWVAIPSESAGANYTGRFDGNGYVIANLNQNTSSANGGGLFRGLSTSTGLITRVGLFNVSVTSTATSNAILGGLVSQMASGAVVEHSYIKYGTVTVAAGGGASNAPIAGGLIGRMNGSTVRYSYADVTVTQPTGSDAASRMGGLVGLVENGSNVNYTYAQGNVQGGRGTHTAGGIGGLVGRITGTSNSFVTYSYATGAISFGTSGVSHGGLVGSRSSANAFVTNSYFSREIEASTGGGGISRTTAQLRTGANTYTGFGSGWDYGGSSQFPARTFSYSGGDSGARQTRALNLQHTDIDYDMDNDDLIEVKTLAQLNAIRLDLDADGSSTNNNYALAFHGFSGSCNATCNGYELNADLDFAGSVYTSWIPIGPSLANSYDGNFDGNGHTISNLTISGTTGNRVGLFGVVAGAVTTIENVGLLEVDIVASYAVTTGTAAVRAFKVGALVGLLRSSATVRSSYATGTINANSNVASNGAFIQAGGLVGHSDTGTIAASWAAVNINTGSNSSYATDDTVGGLIGSSTSTNANDSTVTAAYATGNVSTARSGTARCIAGGLVGNPYNASITASYSTGAPTCADERGGLLGRAAGTISASYWDTNTSGISTSAGGANVVGKTTAQLQAGTGSNYAGDFANWNVDVDGDTATAMDDPWDFGVTGHYPILKYDFGATAPQVARNTRSQRMQRSPYDTDGDYLLEIGGAGVSNLRGLHQLNAVRYDLTGGGDTFAMSAADRTAYQTAFPNQLRCGHGGCHGYELAANLDFDTGTAGDRTDDAYYNGGAGWTPLGPGAGAAAYTGAFHGNGRTIANLMIASTDVVNVGLFGWANGGPIENVGLTNVDITANYAGGNATYTFSAGAVAGTFTGALRGSYATGSITMDVTDTGTNSAGRAGGLVGGTFGATTIAASYAQTAVTLTSTSTAGQFDNAGGIVGVLGNTGAVIASYATGAVSANRDSSAVGGLIGLTGTSTTVDASYATGQPTAAGSTPMVGGLIGNPANTPTITASYWDTATSLIDDDIDNDAPEGLTTRALQTPSGYIAGGIYADWNVNVDGDAMTGDAAGNDDPWHFAGPDHYPILKFGHRAASYATQLGLANVDYDADDDNLIDVSNLHQLNAIRYDADGNGPPAAFGAAQDGYALAYPAAAADAGCPSPDGCIGYELLNDLDFDTAGSDRIADAPYAEWTPLPEYTAIFDGKGHTIANLNVNLSSSVFVNAGLFSQLSGADAVISSLGLLDPTINVAGATVTTAGALVGFNSTAQIYAVYVNGGSVTVASNNAYAGGLVGRSTGVGARISASYARDVPVAVSGAGGSSQYAGGLVGHHRSGADITASYAASTVANTGTSGDSRVGGLVGFNDLGGSPDPTVTNSYYDNSVEDDAAASDATSGQTTVALTTPTAATAYATGSIYETWNTYDIDNADADDDLTTNTAEGEDAAGDAPWDFGTALQYPILTFGFGEAAVTRQRLALTFTDYDTDDDGLIEVDSLAKLHAIRYDLNGDGRPNSSSDADTDGHARGYPNFISGSCPDDDDPADGASFDCRGYELTADLDFDENGDGTVDGMDWGALYHNNDAGWLGIGTGAADAESYNAVFDGNGHAIANLYINRATTNYQGLFRYTGASSRIVGVGLPDVNVTGQLYTGALAGRIAGPVTSCWVTGAVNGRHYAGMLVGEQRGTVSASWASGQVTTTPGSLDSGAGTGGLVSNSHADIIASYSHATVTGGFQPGGLTAWSNPDSNFYASYAAGRLVNTGTPGNIAGLAGTESSGANPDYTDSWFDQHATTAAVREYQHTPATDNRATTTDLIATDDYTGNFANWNDYDVDDADGDDSHATGADSPWDFGDAFQYPILTFGHSADSIARQKAAFTLLDYDTDDDGLIEVGSLLQLNAIRYDVNGDGLLTGRGTAGRNAANSYAAAYPKLSSNSCPDGDDADSDASFDCHGYELTGDLDFDENDDGMITEMGDPTYWNGGAGWQPIGGEYTATFNGNGYAISNLYINRTASSGQDYVGLFSEVDGANAVIRSVGLLKPTVSVTGTGGNKYVGALVGHSENGAYIYGSYVVDGSVTVNAGSTLAGGLVGRAGASNAQGTGSPIVGSYVRNTPVSIAGSGGSFYRVGGLVGGAYFGSHIRASYAASTISNTGGNPGDRSQGGLVGFAFSSNTPGSYHDRDVDPNAGGATGQISEVLLTATDYTDELATWDDFDVDNADGDRDDSTNPDAPWDFGNNLQYPILTLGHSAASIAGQRATATLIDYDTDDDGLIEVDSLAKLNAIRYDLDGNGQVTAANAANYTVAYPKLSATSCPDNDDPADGASFDCLGYELTGDLDFDTGTAGDRTDDDYHNGGAGWVGIGTGNTAGNYYNAVFQGHGHAIANLFISRSTASEQGLFRFTGPGSHLVGVGLPDVNVTGQLRVGALAGRADGRVTSCWVTGQVAAQHEAGMLLGDQRGRLAASWTAGQLTLSPTGGDTGESGGGLVGSSYAPIVASYSHAAVTDQSSAHGVAGLASWGSRDSDIIASYAAGRLRSPGSRIGLVGIEQNPALNQVDYTDSYWDVDATSATTRSRGHTPVSDNRQSTDALVSPIDYGTEPTDIYRNWNVNADNDATTGDADGNDDPWDFGTNLQYPILTFGHSADSIARQRVAFTLTDYDVDNDGLIEVDTLVKLNAIRYDLDGNGQVSDADAANYGVAFPKLVAGSCPDGDDMDSDASYDCRGYELTADLDFDTGTAGDRTDDEYYNGGAGWAPIGVDTSTATRWNAEFHGNGRLISNLFISRGATDDNALFGATDTNAAIIGVGLPGVSITGRAESGALIGTSRGSTIAAVWSSGAVEVSQQNAGGLVGTLRDSSTITASYSTASITGSSSGGLAGSSDTSTIRYSYAVGTIAGTSTGLAGSVTSATAINSYVDATFTGVSGGETTASLQTTIGYTGIYENWNADVDNADNDNDPTTNMDDGENAAGDDPWDFVANYQYPILKYGGQATSRVAQLTPQDATLRAVGRPSNVDRVRQTGATDYLMEVDSPETMVALPPALFTPTQPGATVALPTTDTTGASVGGDDGDVVTLGPGEPPTLAVIRVTSPSGRSVLPYTVTIQRIFCPKASLRGPSDVVGEGGVAEFTVLVCGETEGPVVATWSAAGAASNSAQAGDLGNAANTGPLSEFPTGQTITVPAGDDRTATIRIPIYDDDTPEGPESFTVTLTGVSGGTERYDDDAPETAIIELSDPTLDLRAPDGTGAGGAGDGPGSDTPLTASSRLILMEGATNAYTMQLAADPGGAITIVIHSNHEGVTTTPDRVTFTGGDGGSWQNPQRVTVNAAPDGDDNNEQATLTHILTDASGGLIEIIDRIPLFIADTDPPEDDDIC